MACELKTGDRIIMLPAGGVASSSRVKQVKPKGCLVVSYLGKTVLEAGVEVEVRSKRESTVRIYYMQVQATTVTDHPQVLLERNPGARFNKRRHSWRVPFSVPAGIREIRTPHFRSATCCDICLEGVRIVSDGKWVLGTQVELRLKFPECPEHILSGKVIRVSSGPVRADVYGQDLYGLVILFNPMNQAIIRDLTLFLWREVRNTYPHEMRMLYDMGHRRKPRTG